MTGVQTCALPIYTVTGLKLSPNTGGLLPDQNSPFLANGQPTCLTTVPNGAHASQSITP